MLLGVSQDLQTVSHELFHGYQYENGTGGTTINNEVEAYLYGIAVETQYAFDNNGLAGGIAGRDNEAGRVFEDSFYDLLYSKKFDFRTFRNAVYNFKRGSTKNQYGLYNRFRVNKPDPYNTLIQRFFPLIR